jgi:hypothetical protein
MAVQITHVRFSGYSKSEETIVAYRWFNPSDGKTGDSDKPTMVDFIDNKKGDAYVGTGTSKVSVGVIHPTQGQPYLRTYADGQWNNNLVNLPTF